MLRYGEFCDRLRAAAAVPDGSDLGRLFDGLIGLRGGEAIEDDISIVRLGF
jgi:hypothetical protein